MFRSIQNLYIDSFMFQQVPPTDKEAMSRAVEKVEAAEAAMDSLLADEALEARQKAAKEKKAAKRKKEVQNMHSLGANDMYTFLPTVDTQLYLGGA